MIRKWAILRPRYTMTKIWYFHIQSKTLKYKFETPNSDNFTIHCASWKWEVAYEVQTWNISDYKYILLTLGLLTPHEDCETLKIMKGWLDLFRLVLSQIIRTYKSIDKSTTSHDIQSSDWVSDVDIFPFVYWWYIVVDCSIHLKRSIEKSNSLNIKKQICKVMFYQSILVHEGNVEFPLVEFKNFPYNLTFSYIYGNKIKTNVC